MTLDDNDSNFSSNLFKKKEKKKPNSMVQPTFGDNGRLPKELTKE